MNGIRIFKVILGISDDGFPEVLIVSKFVVGVVTNCPVIYLFATRIITDGNI